MSTPGNFRDLLELLEAVPAPPPAPSRAKRRPPSPAPHGLAEQQWIVSGILRFAFTAEESES